MAVALDSLAAGRAPDESMKSYPPISREASQATLCYAADLAKEFDE